MSQRRTISGRRSSLVWLSTLFALALVAIIVVVVFLVAPDRRRQQQLEAHYKACIAFQSAGDWDKAVDACAQAVAIDGSYKDVQSRYAEVLSRQREATATAIAVAATATADALEVHYQKGLAYMDLKRWDEARAEMEQVFEIDPDYKDVQEKLAHIERASSEIAPTPTALPSRRVVEIAAGKPATASDFWRGSDPTHVYLPSYVTDRETDESYSGPGYSTYWLLPDHQTGWVQIDLQQSYTIVKVRWLNTHNAQNRDRATTRFHIAVSQTGAFEGEERTLYSGTMPFSVSPTYQETALSSPVEARYVRFYVDEYYDWGGGLNELEVYAEVPAP